MRFGASLLLSARYMFSTGPQRTWSLKRIRGGIYGIALSLVPLVVVFQVANGMIEGITSRYIETATYHMQVVNRDFWGENQESEDAVLAKIRALKGVTYAGTELNGLGLAAGAGGSDGVTIRAVPPELGVEPGFARYIKIREGAFDLSDSKAIVLGDEVAAKLGAKTGDQIRLVTALDQGNGKYIPKVSMLHVTGIVSSGYQVLDKLWVFVSLERGRQIMPPGSAEEFIGVKVSDPYKIENPLFAPEFPASEMVKPADIEAALGGFWGVTTWFDSQRDQFLSFVTTRNLLLFILVLIVLVASVNVSSSMIMMVMEKQHEIAIIKSMGASPVSLAAVFVTIGGSTGLIGTVAGLILGALASVFVNEILVAIEWLINFFGQIAHFIAEGSSPYDGIKIFNPEFYLDRIPINIRAADILLIGVLTVALSMVVSFIPASRAARLRPLSVFRKA